MNDYVLDTVNMYDFINCHTVGFFCCVQWVTCRITNNTQACYNARLTGEKFSNDCLPSESEIIPTVLMDLIEL
jgi:hypothetical protein